MELLSNLGLVGFGGVLGVIIQHYLSRSSLIAERHYQFQKEELLEYKKHSERIIEKLLLLDGHRDLFYSYLQLNYNSYKQEGSLFIDLNNTFDKTNFDKNKEYVATIIFLYFPELTELWNDCLDSISSIATLIHKVSLSKSKLSEADWKSILDDFNNLQQSFGNKPGELGSKIKEIITNKESVFKDGKPKFSLF